jgi:hypothetical protein
LILAIDADIEIGCDFGVIEFVAGSETLLHHRN